MDLSNYQQKLIFDCCFHCADAGQIKRGTALIDSNPEAANLCSCLEGFLGRLSLIKEQSCPDSLVDLTIARLKLATMKKHRPHNNTAS